MKEKLKGIGRTLLVEDNSVIFENDIGIRRIISYDSIIKIKFMQGNASSNSFITICTADGTGMDIETLEEALHNKNSIAFQPRKNAQAENAIIEIKNNVLNKSRATDKTVNITYCPNCGNEGEGRFCTECGQQLEDRVTSTEIIQKWSAGYKSKSTNTKITTNIFSIDNKTKLEKLEEKKAKEELKFVKEQRKQAEKVAKCPKCGSTSLSAHKKGYGIVKGGLGAIAGGAFAPIGVVVGLGAGNMGSKKVLVTCLKCGKQFKA